MIVIKKLLLLSCSLVVGIGILNSSRLQAMMEKIQEQKAQLEAQLEAAKAVEAEWQWVESLRGFFDKADRIAQQTAQEVTEIFRGSFGSVPPHKFVGSFYRTTIYDFQRTLRETRNLHDDCKRRKMCVVDRVLGELRKVAEKLDPLIDEMGSHFKTSALSFHRGRTYPYRSEDLHSINDAAMEVHRLIQEVMRELVAREKK